MTDASEIDCLLDAWQAAAAGGRDVPAGELCAARPDLAPAVEARVAVLRQFYRLARSADGPAATSDLVEPVRAGPADRPTSDSDQPVEQTLSFEPVVDVCRAFRARWAAGSRPSLDSLIDAAEADARPALLRNLLAIELERRRAAGERPTVDEYVGRFPSHAALVRELFLDQSSVPDEGNETAHPPRSAPVAATRLGPYRLVAELGRGGMGVVYEAVHADRGTRVALKTLPAVDGAALYRFKREFRSLAGFNHPNLVGLHTLEADGANWFFTMDLVAGTDWLRHVRPNKVLDEGRLRAALAQLATGVMALHARNAIHRDLKPSNVQVTPDGRVVLLDFGLVAELDRPGTTQSLERAAGTPLYMAPEQTRAGPVTPAADWYAVGVMLYEALSGRAPFTGPLWEVLDRKRLTDPDPLPPGVPPDLADLAMRLLVRDPAARADALAVTRVVAATTRPAPAPDGSRKLVGRDAQLAALADAYQSVVRDHRPVTVFVSGRSGEGKTALGDQFLAGLRRDGRAAVMSGRCYDRESVPFKALDTLIDALSTYLRGLPESEAALLMPDDIGHLAQVFPVLQRVDVVSKAADTRAAALDEQQVRQRAFRALRSLLGRLSRRGPVVWLVDDLQWGDADSAAALFEVLRPPDAPAVLFVGTYRSDETEGSAFLKAWKELQAKHGVEFADRDVRVGPLSEAECAELVVGVVGRDTPAIRARAAEFAKETRGNPFLLIELAGCFDPDTDSFQAMPLHEVLARKLGRLPPEAGPLLDVIAVSGQALSVAEATRTAGLADSPLPVLNRMRNERLVRLIGSDDDPVVDTYHDRVRETVLADMPAGKRTALHRALAEVIETEVGGIPAEMAKALETGEAVEPKPIPRVYDLAYHFDAAGDRTKALAYALLAAEQARRQSALEVAVNNYSIAKRNASADGGSLRYRIAVGNGEALMLLGRYTEAATELGDLDDRVEDVQKNARLDVLRGEIAFKEGRIDESARFFERGLGSLGIRVPGTLAGLTIGILRQAAIQLWHVIWPGRLHRRAGTVQLDLVVGLFNRLGLTAVFQSSPKMLWAHLSGLNRAELGPPSRGLAMSYAEHGCWMAMLGLTARGVRYGQRARALAGELDDLWSKGNGCNYPGIGLYASARYPEGIGLLTDAINFFERAGDMWESHLAQFHKGCCHFGLGDLSAAVAEARSTFDSCARLGDSRAMCASWLWARAATGDVPFDRMKACLPDRPDDVMSTVHATLAEGCWHSFHGRTVEALGCYERAADMVWSSRCVNSHTILVLPMLASGLRLRASAVAAEDRRLARRLLKRAARLGHWATRLTRFFPAAYPLALRERALVLADLGKTRKALKLADKSCRVAEGQKAKYEHARSLLVRGRLAKELGRPEGDEQVRAAEAAIAEMEKPIRQPAAKA